MLILISNPGIFVGVRRVDCANYSGMNYNNGMNSGSSSGGGGQGSGTAHHQSSSETGSNGYSNWNGSPSSTLSYTETMQPPPVSDLRTHSGYCKFFVLENTFNLRYDNWLMNRDYGFRICTF